FQIIEANSNTHYVFWEVSVGFCIRFPWYFLRIARIVELGLQPTRVLLISVVPSYGVGKCRVERAYPAFRPSIFGVSLRPLSSSQSNDRALAVVSIGSSCGMSSATDAPSSPNFRADTSTRFSIEPIALL